MLDWLKNLLNLLVGVFKKFVKAAFPIVKQVVIAELKDYAIMVVVELASTDLSNEEKRSAALKKILDEGEKRGLEVGESLGRTLAEMAYQYYKEEIEGKI